MTSERFSLTPSETEFNNLGLPHSTHFPSLVLGAKRQCKVAELLRRVSDTKNLRVTKSRSFDAHPSAEFVGAVLGAVIQGAHPCRLCELRLRTAQT